MRTLVLSLLVACTDPGPSEPTLTPEQQAALDAELASAAGKADGFGLGLYHSHYVNLTVSGTSEDGAPFALVAGKHAQNFPYFAYASKWDNVLLLVGDTTAVVSARDLAGLSITVSSALHGATTIGFHGTARRADNTAARVDLDLVLDNVRFDAMQLGIPYSFLDLDETPGMRWQPYALHGTGTVSIDSATARPVTAAGELETGDLTNVRAPEFAIAYDYVSIATGDYGYVTFVSHALHPDGVLGGLVEWYLTRYATKTLTLQAGSERDGNPNGVDTNHLTVVAHDVVDLGLATLDRQLVRTTDRAGRAAFGLREVFHAR